MYEKREFHMQILDHLKLPKSTFISIIYWHNRQQKQQF